MLRSIKNVHLKNTISTTALAAGLILISSSFAAQAEDRISQADWDVFYGGAAPAQTAPTPRPAQASSYTPPTTGEVTDADMEAFLNGTMASQQSSTAGMATGVIPANALPMASLNGCSIDLEQDGDSSLDGNLESGRCELIAAAEDESAKTRQPADPIDSSVVPPAAPSGLTGTPLDIILDPIAEAAGIESGNVGAGTTGTPLDVIIDPVAGAVGGDDGATEGPTGTPLDVVLGPIVDAVGGDDGATDGPTGTPLDVVLGPIAGAIAGDDAPPAGDNRTIVGSLDTTVDTLGAGDTDRDNDNDQTDLTNNLQLAVTLLLAELTNSDVENHVLATTLADLQEGGPGLQLDLARLLIGDGRQNNDLATDLQNILGGLTTPDGGDDNPPGQGERTIVGTLDTTVDTLGAGDTNGDQANNQTDFTNNLQLAVLLLLAELTNADTDSHVLATTLADLQGGGDDLQADLGRLLLGEGALNNDLATDLENILVGLTTPDGAGGGAAPTGTPLDLVLGPVVDLVAGDDGGQPGAPDRTIVGSLDDTTEILGASQNQTDLSNNLTIAAILLVNELANPNPSGHVLATTLTDLQGGGDDLQNDLQNLLLGDGALNRSLDANLVNLLTGLTTPGTGGGLTGTPLDLILDQIGAI